MTDPVPYDIAAHAAAGGAAHIRWPVGIVEVKALNRDLLASLVAVVRAENDADTRDVLAIAAPTIMITLLTEATVALTVARAKARDMPFHHKSPSLAAELDAGRADSSGRIYDLVTTRFAAATRPARTVRLRDLAHGFVANRGPRLGLTRALVLNHNTLMRRTMRTVPRKRFSYRAPSLLFGGPVNVPDAPPTRRHADLADAIVAGTRSALNRHGAALIPAHADRLAARTAAWLGTVAAHRARLDRTLVGRTPELWTGTGGNYATRQVRAAMRRRGTTVVGFEHGGGGHIHRGLGAEIVNEFWLADRFVADTEEKAAVYREGLDGSPFALGTIPSVTGAPRGAASFRWAESGPRNGVKRLMYVTTAFVGETCYPIQPLMPDPVYADWQVRLIDGLAGEGFEMLVKPHPGGITKGKPPVASGRGTYLSGPFEQAMARADAFVFDYPATTTLWEAMCTGKPVLFVDLGLADWPPEVRALFDRRCAVVRGQFDENNRPVADFAAMRAALADAPHDDAFAATYLTGTPRP